MGGRHEIQSKCQRLSELVRVCRSGICKCFICSGKTLWLTNPGRELRYVRLLQESSEMAIIKLLPYGWPKVFLKESLLLSVDYDIYITVLYLSILIDCAYLTSTKKKKMYEAISAACCDRRLMVGVSPHL